MIAVGFLLTSASMFWMMRITPDVDFHTIVWMRVFQVVGLPLIFIPISTLAYVGMRQGDNNQVSGISNFVRNLGGAVGVSFLVSYLSRHRQISRVDLAAHLHPGNVFFDRYLVGTAAVGRSNGKQRGRGRSSLARTTAANGRCAGKRSGLHKRILCSGRNCRAAHSNSVPDEAAYARSRLPHGCALIQPQFPYRKVNPHESSSRSLHSLFAASAFAAGATSLTGQWSIHNSIAGNDSDQDCKFVQQDNRKSPQCVGLPKAKTSQ